MKTWHGRATSVHSVEELAVGREELNAAVLAIGDVHGAVGVDGDAVRHVKLPRPAPRLAPREQQPAVGRRTVDARVAVAVGDVHLAVRRERQVGRIVERRPRPLIVR